MVDVQTVGIDQLIHSRAAGYLAQGSSSHRRRLEGYRQREAEELSMTITDISPGVGRTRDAPSAPEGRSSHRRLPQQARQGQGPAESGAKDDGAASLAKVHVLPVAERAPRTRVARRPGWFELNPGCFAEVATVAAQAGAVGIAWWRRRSASHNWPGVGVRMELLSVVGAAGCQLLAALDPLSESVAPSGSPLRRPQRVLHRLHSGPIGD
jgi:hypothetical protein